MKIKNFFILFLILYYSLSFTSENIVKISAEKQRIKSYKEKFLELYNEIYDPANGYISQEGIPYHSIEKLIIEAHDYGRHSTSEAISFLIWLDVLYAYFTKDWKPFEKSWYVMEKYFIPDKKTEQLNMDAYNFDKPASYVPEYLDPYKFPAPVIFDEPVGMDPLDDVTAKYGHQMYLMHWLLDVDDWYGFSKYSGGRKRAVFVNLFQRGPNESTWETIPHPSIENYTNKPQGFVDLFVQSNATQWRYTCAPDAEARVAQAFYWAEEFAKQQKWGKISDYRLKMYEMGDWLRYCMFDKYFKKIGAGRTPGKGYDSCHYLISWYIAWGAALNEKWAWRIGCSQIHCGYQNPLGAYYLAKIGVDDWDKSLKRQIELIEFCQALNGAIGGGVVNDWDRPNGPFYGMQYCQHPVFLDPPSNTWSGWQYWLMERVFQYIYASGDKKAFKICEKWLKEWALKEMKLKDNDIEIPVGIDWEGSADNSPKDLKCKVTGYGKDVGLIGAFVKCLIFWDQANRRWFNKPQPEAQQIAKKILDIMWERYRDDKGIVTEEERADYARFWEQVVPLPKGVKKVFPWGKELKEGVRFFETRPDYGEPLPPKGPYNQKNPPPKYKYHRTWQQIAMALAYGYYAMFYEGE
ncbi:MAG: glycoside hydrolase family 48 protein [Elusimicrobiota bacterium]|nr:hypothetical protein [Endomicrobiia bacterium]MDW8165083.1 glycoside hydrolase family 48 protein [Elusimicrobiota bacterium]